MNHKKRSTVQPSITLHSLYWNNPQDKFAHETAPWFAVAVVRDDQIVGHVPKDISKLCASILLSG